MPKYYYSLVVSVIDEYGNRINSIDITGCNNKKQIKKARTTVKEAIKHGKYSQYANKNNGEYLRADIEVHDNDEYYLLLWGQCEHLHDF